MRVISSIVSFRRPTPWRSNVVSIGSASPAMPTSRRAGRRGPISTTRSVPRRLRLDVRELIEDLVEADGAISMSAGVDSGPVTVGLTGGSRLVYDAWGSTVRNATDLARLGPARRGARVGGHAVAAAVELRDRGQSGHGSAGVVIVSGRTTEDEPV